MMYAVVVLSALTCASAFSMRMAADGMSASMPFLKAPKNLEGMAGGVGFDPLGFSDYLDPKWMRESELKHGRVSMLAVVGWLVQSAGVHVPGEAYQVNNPIDAVFSVGPSPLLQIFCGIGAAESIMHNGKLSMMDMHKDSDRAPGNFGKSWGADRLKGLNAKELEAIQTKELKNGRLAMFAIGGLVHHQLIAGTETFGQLDFSQIHMPMNIAL